MKTAPRALRYFLTDWPGIAIVFLLMLASVGLNVLKPWPLALIVDSVLGGKSLPAWIPGFVADWDKTTLIIAFSVGVFLLHLAQSGLSAFQNHLSIRLSLAGLARVRTELFAKLHRLSLAFHHGSRSGDLIYRASWDTYAFQTLFQQGLMTFLTALFSLAVMTGVMAKMNLKLAIFAVAVIPLLVFAVQFFGRRMGARSAAAQKSDSRVTSHVQQNIASVQLIQSYTMEEVEQRIFAERIEEARQTRSAQHGAELLYWFGVAAVFALGTTGFVWIGSGEVLAGKLTIGELTVFLGYLALLYDPLNQISHVGATVSAALAGARRVFEILDEPEEIHEKQEARRIAFTVENLNQEKPNVLRLQGRISFEDVSFAYQPGRLILSSFTLDLAPQESIALMGPSGSGKSTILNLVQRFYDPVIGAVKLDGVDVRDLKLKDLRSRIAWVPQQPVLLPGTIAENIGCGRPGSTHEQIVFAARQANADEFISSLPEKYNTVVGDGAVRLSVGEQQRINLARAFLKNAPILLLDEATSALDAESERLVLKSIQTLMADRTTIIVAHRLETIQSVKRVAVVRDGRVSAVGTPSEIARML
jgi:ATP-binding cassette, subfamily B, bacterial